MPPTKIDASFVLIALGVLAVVGGAFAHSAALGIVAAGALAVAAGWFIHLHNATIDEVHAEIAKEQAKTQG